MSSAPLRSSRPASITSSFLQNTSPRLPSPLNPAPNVFSPSTQSNTPRNSPVGETLEPLYSIREGDGSESMITPTLTDSQSLDIPCPRTISFSRSPHFTQVQAQVHASNFSSSVDMSPVLGSIPQSRYQVQPRTYGRHSSPSSSPYGQGIPFPTSPPLSSSPLTGLSRSSLLVTHSPPMSESSRPLSPSSNGVSRQGSPASIHGTRSQFQPPYRSPPQPSQSHFQLPQTSPAQTSPTSPPSASSSSFRCPRQSLIQQSFANAYEVHGNASGFSSIHHDVQHRSPPFGTHPHMSPQGSPTQPQYLSANVPQHVSPANSDMAALYEVRRTGTYGPAAFRDDEIRESFDEVISAGPTDSCASGVAYPQAAVGYGTEEGSVPRTVSMAMASVGASSIVHRSSLGDQIRRDGYEMEIGGPPSVESTLAVGMMAQGDRRGTRSRASSIRSQGSTSGARPSGFMHVGDVMMSGQATVKVQEIAHTIEHASERGYVRRMSNASIRSTSSRGSRMSGPAQSPSQAMLVSSQSQTQTYSSLSSFGVGLEEVEREERRSKTFFHRKRAGSAADSRKEDRLSPRVPDGVMSGEHGDLLSSNSNHVGDHATASQSPKEVAKHGSLIVGSKNTTAVEQQNDGYYRAEKYVSMAVTSILSPSTIRTLSPLGDVLIKAAHTAAFVGQEAAPVVRDALSVSSTIFAFVPIPGLEEAAKALLNIWDACQKVDTNRVSCLRLVERCATLLHAVQREVSEAGEDVASDLAAPLAQLCTALNSVRSFLEAQIHRPLLARYVRRDEITRDLAGCNQVVTDAAERFGISVQIRTLKELYAAEHESRQFVEEAMESMRMDNHLMHMQLLECIQSQSFAQGRGTAGLPAGNALGLTTEGVVVAGSRCGQSSMKGSLMPTGGGNGSFPNTPTALTWNVSGAVDYAASPTPTRTTFLAAETTRKTEATVALSHTIAGVYHAQDSKDADADVAALRGRFADAIDTGNDVELLRGLQIGEGEIPEVAMTLGRVLGLRGHDEEEHVVEPIDGSDRKIMERGMDAMTRLTNGGGDGLIAWDLPHWTITRYEVSQMRKIGAGFFSDVYLGHWRGRMVVIKVLKLSVPRDIFVREINVWHSLNHPNVLPLYGASSASGDRPWFLVSKFCSGASLIDWLRARANAGDANTERVDLLKCIYEIARGMEYLHLQGVLHGDLKAANVLVDENGRCVVSDFGHSQMKAQAYQLSGQTMPLGEPQWKAPELLMGDNRPTPAGDVYAFGICCIEILGMGDSPMLNMDAGLFVASALDKDVGPKIPSIARYKDVADAIEDLICSCWVRDPAMRPSFARIVCSLEEIRGRQGLGYEQSLCTPPAGQVLSILPNLAPIYSAPSPLVDTGSVPTTSNESSPADEQYETASEALTVDIRTASVPLCESESSTGEPVSAGSRVSNTAIHIRSNQHSEFSCSSSQASSHMFDRDPTHDGCAPYFADERQVGESSEESYRLIAGVNHAFHDSLTLPLWSPVPVELGAVGYLDKSRGEFVTLFNAFEPPRCSKADLCHVPSFYGYGKLPTYSREGGKRSVAQRSLSALSGFLTFKTRGERSSPDRVARQYSFPLERGKTAAHLCVERTLHRFIEDLDIPKTWFTLQVNQILKVFGPTHGIRKEDLIVVVGALDALDYALFISDAHPDGRVHFNVLSDRKKGEPWGMFTMERVVQHGGSGYLTSQNRWVEASESEQAMLTSKVSTVRVTDAGGPLPCDGMDTVLLAGLRFGLDQQEPTLL